MYQSLHRQRPSRNHPNGMWEEHGVCRVPDSLLGSTSYPSERKPAGCLRGAVKLVSSKTIYSFGRWCKVVKP